MSKLTNLSVEHVSLVDRAAVRDPSNPTAPQKFLLWKAQDGAPTNPGGSMPETATPEELRAELTKAQTERDAAVAKADELEQRYAKLEKKEGQSKIDKSQLDPAVREALEKAEQDAEQTRKRAEAAEQIAKAERELPHIGNSSEVGPLLKRASETLEKADYDLLEQRLSAANEQIAKGELFKQFGRDGQPSGGDSTVESELHRKAEDIRKADGVNRSEAMKRAMRDNPELAAQYVAAQR